MKKFLKFLKNGILLLIASIAAIACIVLGVIAFGEIPSSVGLMVVVKFIVSILYTSMGLLTLCILGTVVNN